MREAFPDRRDAAAGSSTVHLHAVADVMGGIGEDSGTLLLTTTLDLSFVVSMWPSAGSSLDLQLITADQAAPRSYSLAAASLTDPAGDPARIAEECRSRGAEWAAPACLALRQALIQAPPARLAGLAVVIHTDLPPDVDMGRHTVLAAAIISAWHELNGVAADALTQSRLASDAVLPLVGVHTVRTAMTALHGPLDGAMLQLRFFPQLFCEPLPLPQGVALSVVRTHLARPVRLDRMIETHTCSLMGHRIIVDLQSRAAQATGARPDRLASVTPTEFVERYRDLIPSKISGKAFTARFGAFRGLNGDLDPQDTYKVRSRAEHHIYENRRVHEFATHISRARRAVTGDALPAAGELMYASHWSHSQRCGIGGVEADRFVTAVKQFSPGGLFGAKVTGMGAGGELVVLHRDNEAGHAAMAQAMRLAEQATNRAFRVYATTRSAANLTPASTSPVAAPVPAAV